MDKHKRNQWLFALANVLVASALVYFFNRAVVGAGPKEVSYSEFLAEVRAGHMAEVQITDKTLLGVLKEEKPDSGKPAPAQILKATRLPGINETTLLQELDAHGVKFSGKMESGGWLYVLASWVLPLLVMAGIYTVGMRQMKQSGGPLSFGKNRAKIHDQSDQVKVTFEDVAGVDEAKAELVEVVDFLKHPKKYQALGGRIPKGVLLVGPPGTGKTLLARAVAGEAGVAFFSISGSEFVEMFVGVGAARVRDLFDQAKAKAPCMIFIDELDAIGKSRSAAGVFSNDEREQTLNQLLVEMDGFDSSEGVIMMAATNEPEVLDPALLRGGRFDRQVTLDRPDLAGREAILRVHTRQVKLAADVDLSVVAARTPGMVGSDMATIVNEAALQAAQRGAAAVEMRDFEEAIDRVMLGLEKKKQVMSPEEKERVAHHESGHTLVALTVKHADPVHRVSIIPRTIGALGFTLQLPLHEKYLMTQPEIEDQVAVMLGGRAAEEIIYQGVVSTGASNDLERASELVRQVVTRFGMSAELGPLTWGIPTAARFLQTPFANEQRNYSEQTAQMIDEEARRIVGQIYTRAKGILTQREADLKRIAAELIRKETLYRADLDRLLAQSEVQTQPTAAS
ncbi:MAG TPA: ATP-dependent zinc metalloprotease FtsH [Candidatus Eremiobacteraceae bacterium]|nr:ATP-dependent zinc metalloprotease FtsH [Candidatus Eremiobacteraceae bacterium]